MLTAAFINRNDYTMLPILRKDPNVDGMLGNDVKREHYTYFITDLCNLNLTSLGQLLLLLGHAAKASIILIDPNFVKYRDP